MNEDLKEMKMRELVRQTGKCILGRGHGFAKGLKHKCGWRGRNQWEALGDEAEFLGADHGSR